MNTCDNGSAVAMQEVHQAKSKRHLAEMSESNDARL